MEFLALRRRRTRHPGEFFVHAEIVLNSDGGVREAFALDGETLFGFYRLVQPF